MLVFVSDLHISDRTTGVQFLEVDAFCEALCNIGRQAEQAGSTEVTFVFLGDIFDMVRTTFWTVPGQQQGFWAERDPNKDPNHLIAPWDENVIGSDLEAASLYLLKQITQHPGNYPIFDLWSKPLKDRRFRRVTEDRITTTELLDVGDNDGEGQPIWPCEVEPRRVYIPGNHDRLVNQFDSLRAEVISSLKLDLVRSDGVELPPDGSVRFLNSYHNANYKVFARHGHEWDNFNFEQAARWSELGYAPSDKDYLDIPLGEIIANEFSRLPIDVANKLNELLEAKIGHLKKKQRLAHQQAWENEINRIVEQLKVVDDVRPMAAVVPWLFDSVSTNPVLSPYKDELLDALLEALADAATRLEQSPFVKQWLKRHDQLFKVDETEGVQLVLNALQAIQKAKSTLGGILDPYATVRKIAQQLASQGQTQSGNNYEGQALTDLGRVRASGLDVLYILYGHTHWATQVPLTVPDAETPHPVAIADGLPLGRPQTPPPACAVYLNTGTWRPLATQAQKQDGFMRWKSLTFTLFYNSVDDEKSAAQLNSPTFETWSGTLLSPLH